MNRIIDLTKAKLTALHTGAEQTAIDGEPVLRVVKTEKLHDYDTNSYVKVGEMDFHNGIIEVDVHSRLLPDAPALSRGFIGIAFRIAEGNDRFESFYIRPTNGRCEDPERKQHAAQYFSFPKYTFSYFRENGITGYEAPADIGLEEWIRIRAEIHGCCGKFFVNGTPVLTVRDLKLGEFARGAVGLFVDIGTEGFFKNLKVICEDGGGNNGSV